jgi:hypothetical protein
VLVYLGVIVRCVARETIDGMDVDLERLPDGFDSLKPLIRRWACGDDVARGAMQDAAATDELLELVGAVEPHFAAINAYLDGHDEEEAHLLGNLAEGAVEAHLELGRRGIDHR